MQIFKSIVKGLMPVTIRTVSAAEAKQLIDGSRPPFILDVRQPEEFKGGHIPNAVLVPLNELGNQMGKLPKDVDILTVCRSGARSSAAARLLAEQGFRVVNLRGGMMAWEGAGYKIKRGNLR